MWRTFATVSDDDLTYVRKVTRSCTDWRGERGEGNVRLGAGQNLHRPGYGSLPRRQTSLGWTAFLSFLPRMHWSRGSLNKQLTRYIQERKRGTFFDKSFYKVLSLSFFYLFPVNLKIWFISAALILSRNWRLRPFNWPVGFLDQGTGVCDGILILRNQRIIYECV